MNEYRVVYMSVGNGSHEPIPFNSYNDALHAAFALSLSWDCLYATVQQGEPQNANELKWSDVYTYE